MHVQKTISILETPLRANAMAERVIRAGSRRHRHQITRSLFLGALIAITAIAVLLTTSLGGQVTQRSLAVAGAGVFELVVFAEVAAICLLTPIFMAGSIAQESSPRTWDILLTTPLRAPGIVLGNLLGRLFFIIALLVAGLPVLLSLQFLGGVQPRTVLVAMAIAAATALVVASAAVVLSATRTGGRRAVIGYFVGVVIALTATMAADALLAQSVPGIADGRHTTIMTPLNPFLVLEVVLRPGQVIPDAPLAADWITQFWLGQPVLAFLTASALATIGMLGWAMLRVRLLGPVLGRGRSQVEGRRHRPIGRHPITWRASSGRPRGAIDNTARWIWAVLSLAGIATILLLAAQGSLLAQTTSVLLQAAMFIQIGVAVLASVSIAGASVTMDREQGTLDLLLTTPIQPGAYLWGKLLGISRNLLPIMLAPVLCLAVLATIALAATPGRLLPVNTDGQSVVAWGGLIGLAMCLPGFLAFCIAVGLHWSLRCRSSITAVSISSVICLAVAGLLGICALPLTGTQIIGPLMDALSPGPALLSAFHTDLWLDPQSQISPSVQLLVSGFVAGLIWCILTWMILKTTMRSFVFTMRRLAGTS
ncbi:MAG: hypothetical protein MK077_01320 [Phycisphaerales bacterium]|nr:hypothetical protein [Phycisphaerales bacterium]